MSRRSNSASLAAKLRGFLLQKNSHVEKSAMILPNSTRITGVSSCLSTRRGGAGEQFIGIDRLDEIVVGAGAQAIHAVAHLAARGEHEDRAIEAALAHG